MKKILWLSMLFVLVLAFSISIVIIARSMAADKGPNPFIGTWVMDTTLSCSGDGIFKTSVIKFENGKSTQDIVTTEGVAIHIAGVYSTDGKDYATTGSTFVDSMSFYRPWGGAQDYVAKFQRKELYRGRASMSKDGNMFVDAGGGINNDGKPFKWLNAYYRQ